MEVKKNCKYCGSEYLEETGFKTKLKKLFSWNRGDWMWLVIFILIVLSAFAYQRDMKVCKDIAQDTCGYCKARIGICGLATQEYYCEGGVMKQKNETGDIYSTPYVNWSDAIL